MAEQLGRYILDRKIAAGGMAEVFLARQSGPGGFEKICVIKRMLPTLSEDDQFVRMFLDEAKLAAYLNHPHIAQIFDFGQLEGTYYLAMEYVPGSTLRQIVKEHTRKGVFIPVHLVAKLVAQSAIALDYAHCATDTDGTPLNIIHRDVSPQNILLGNTGVVKLIDFGVAKAASASVKTAAGMIKGKFAYMSPEQLRGRPLDKRSDIYALGFVLYELLAGSRAIQGANDAAMMDAALKRKFDPIEARRPDVPAALRDIVVKALQKEREDRYANAADMSADLERYLMLAGHSVTGRDLVQLLSDDARLPVRVTQDETPSARAVVAPKTGTPAGGAFWDDSQPGTQNQRTVIDPSLQLPPPVQSTGPSAATTVMPPSARPTLKEGTPPLDAVTLKRPLPDMLGGGRTPSRPSQQAAVGLAAEESRSSMTRRAAIQRTYAPYVVAALAVVVVLGGLAWALFGGAEDTEDGPPPLEKLQPGQVALPLEKRKAPVVDGTVGQPVEEQKPVVEPKPETVAEPSPVFRPVEKTVVPQKKLPVDKSRKERVPRPVIATEAQASVSISSSPTTTVILDGSVLGRTPLTTQVAAGDHQLIFRDDKLGLKHSRQLRVERGDVRREEWRAGKGRVAFRVVPYGEVYQGAQWLGLTPLAPVDLYEGEHTFKFVNKDTGKDETRVVKVEPGKEVVVKVDLRSGG